RGGTIRPLGCESDLIGNASSRGIADIGVGPATSTWRASRSSRSKRPRAVADLGSNTERLDDQASGGRARVLLLAGDEKAVAYGVRLEARGDYEVRALKLLCLVLDPEGLDLLSDELVDVVLFGVREAGPGLPFDEQAAVREPRLQKRAGGVADDSGGFAGLVEVSDQCVQGVILVERVHGPLPADRQERVVLVDPDAGERFRLLHQFHVLGRVDEAERDEIVGGIAAFVAGVRPLVALELAALGA